MTMWLTSGMLRLDPIVVTLRSRFAQESGSKNRRHKDGRSSCQGCIYGWLDKEGTMKHGKGTGTGRRTFLERRGQPLYPPPFR